MKTITSCVAAAIALLGIGSASAADADKPAVSWVFNDSVSPPDQRRPTRLPSRTSTNVSGNTDSNFRGRPGLIETGDTYRYSTWPDLYTWADVPIRCTAAARHARTRGARKEMRI